MIDTVVIGAGHNGLVAAAYLAAAGQRVVVVERDSIPGGAVSTVERFPGYRVDRGSSAHLMIRHTPILEELALADHGLRYIDCDPWAFSPGSDTHEPIIFYKDLDRTCASIENACGAPDAEAYRAFVAVWSERSAAMMSAFTSSPSPIALGRAFWGLQGRIPGKGASSGLGLSQEFLMSGDSLLDYWFESEQLKAALAWFGAQSGPPMNEPGTAPMVGFAAAMHTIPPGRAIGGSGALTEALVRKLESDGGEVRLSAAATALEKRGDDWLVRCEDGSEQRARSVVSACHILTTLKLLRAGGFDSATADRWAAQIRVGNGIGMAVRLGGTALPSYRGIGDDAGVHSALGLLVTDRGQLARAYADASAGDLPNRPALVAMSYSAIDPTLTPAGHHSTSLWAQWHPYRLSGGRSWSDLAAEAAAGIVAELDRHAPGFSDSIEHTRIQTPADLETELGLTGGNIMHVEMSLDQMMIWRPHPEMAQHRIPGAPGLVLAGASTHPGGGVCGANGRIAATAVLSDRRSTLAKITRGRWK
ncbi:NAD(P)/FAD-dependent oxidoreductase [Williamsia sp. 1135]|uniref:phytoene desaturase family protein n=1 Tax=Williamsia sp. 1135 TaxID=1889262 RepID=UPI000A0FB9E5|nr:NAD(P)/FAD-dependent oxidoreductase [Williamsia sp. 1135]ORM33645.1 FAD-dependent oxidoreductase [Williamsia sp. 1135]